MDSRQHSEYEIARAAAAIAELTLEIIAAEYGLDFEKHIQDLVANHTELVRQRELEIDERIRELTSVRN